MEPTLADDQIVQTPLVGVKLHHLTDLLFEGRGRAGPRCVRREFGVLYGSSGGIAGHGIAHFPH